MPKTLTAVAGDDWQPPLIRYDLARLMRERQASPGLEEPDSEAQLINKIIIESWHLGLLPYHCYYGGGSSVLGSPDLFILGPRGMLVWEAKCPPCDTLNPMQQRWRGLASHAPSVNYSVVTPADWASGKLWQLLLSIAEQDEEDAWEQAA